MLTKFETKSARVKGKEVALLFRVHGMHDSLYRITTTFTLMFFKKIILIPFHLNLLNKL